MTDDKPMRDALVVATDHDRRLARLEADLADLEADPKHAALRSAAAALVGAPVVPPLASEAALVPVAPSAHVGWDAVVAESRAALADDGVDPDALSTADLLDDETIARIENEWATVVGDIDARLDVARIQALTAACRRSVIDSVVKPFGLGKLVARFDKTGGGVLTLNNAEAARRGELSADELAESAHARAYADRQDTAERSPHRGYSAPNYRAARAAPGVVDAYSDKPLDPTRTDIDHVRPASRDHEDKHVNFYFDEQAKEALIDGEVNLAPTDRSVNRSKSDNTIPDWLDREVNGEPNDQRFPVNSEKMMDRHERAERQFLGALRSRQVRHYFVGTVKSGAAEAAKMGLQQALGTLLVEVVVGLFDEVADLVRHGAQAEGVIAEVKIRAGRVVARTFAARGEIIAAFEQGALSGLISAIVTTVINVLKTTCKRTIRLIREGAFSLCKAVRTLAAPPPGMDMAMAAHEASKIAAGALMVSAGVMVEQSMESAISATVPFLAPFAPALTAVTVGLATGLSTVILVAMLDRFDFFGVVARERGAERHRAMHDRVDGMLKALLRADAPSNSEAG